MDVTESYGVYFFEVPESHTGETLAQEFARVLREFGISDKILCITGDNASNNDTMIRELGCLLPDFPGERHRVHCFAHSLNLMPNPSFDELQPLADGEDIDLELDEEELATLREELAEFENAEDALPQVKGKSKPAASTGSETDVETDEDGLLDAREGIDPQEATDLEAEALPIRGALAKCQSFRLNSVSSDSAESVI
ncbi:hypothetical protein VNI00_006167 [Paramarasmius palmivorus]|uniref:Transposase n=1 Tax=Paramarasmius palmivorus TaxID=297713 RepID=A0AAW0D9Y8_9AGAR